MKIFTAALFVLALSFQATAQPVVQPPTASEVFHLRSECAVLSQKILSGLVIPPPLFGSEASHYDPSTNRCYAEIYVQTDDIDTPPEKRKETSRYLYDGQTGEMLAGARMLLGQRSGNVFDGQRLNSDYLDAMADISEKMADDRKQ
jgi:hypothetical protein